MKNSKKCEKQNKKSHNKHHSSESTNHSSESTNHSSESKHDSCKEKKGYVLSNGVKLFYRKRGRSSEKPAILFIHGLAFSSKIWKCQQKYFCKLGYKTVAFDLPGHGKSDKPNDVTKLTTQAMLDDITAVINKLELKQPIIIGHSIAGLYTLGYALQNQNNLTAIGTIGGFHSLAVLAPDAVNAAVGNLITNPNLKNFAISFDTAGVKETTLTKCKEAKHLLKKLIKITLEGSLTSYQLTLLDLLANPIDYTAQLSTINIPALIVHGTIDDSVLPSTGDIIRDAINQGKSGAGTDNTANAVLFEVKDKGHLPHVTEYKLYNAVLHEFINSQTCKICPEI